MNKKIIIAGICIALGVVMLFATAFASGGGTTGYEAYKSAVKNTLTEKSFTGNLEVTLTDNGNNILYANSVMKADREEKASSSSTRINASGQEKTVETYTKGDKIIIKNSDSNVYKVMEINPARQHEKEKARMEKLNPEAMKTGETIIDSLVGNLQNYFTLVDKPEGAKEINLQLSDSQIPAVVNAVASLGAKNASMKTGMGHNVKRMPFDMDFASLIPKLTDEVRIDSIELKALVNKDNLIESQTVNVQISGKDANNAYHRINANIKMDFGKFNSTSADTQDLTGKQIETIHPENYSHKD